MHIKSIKTHWSCPPPHPAASLAQLPDNGHETCARILFLSRRRRQGFAWQSARTPKQLFNVARLNSEGVPLFCAHLLLLRLGSSRFESCGTFTFLERIGWVTFWVQLGCGVLFSGCGLLIKWKFILQKLVLYTANDPIRIPQGHIPLGLIHLWGTLRGVHFTVCRKREMLHVAC